jgi:hypothetical protein
MKYNFRLFFSNLYKSFLKSKGTHAQLSRKRLGFLLLFYFVWPIWGIIVWFSFFLDRIFFPSHRDQSVEKPLFILGNFRSGSTYLQRLIAKDSEQFASATTWDIFMSPSVTLTKIFSGILFIDRKIGSPIKKAFIKFDTRTLGQVDIHKISFLEPEEDENFLLHIWSSFFAGVMFPFISDFLPYIYFDEQLPTQEQTSIMRFYYRMVQRFLFTRQGNPHFLSKNPSFSPKIASIFRHFPNAKIVYLVRNPLEMLPSTISWLGYTWRVFSDPREKYPFISEIVNFTKHWYDYPLNILAQANPDRYLIIKYDELVRDPVKTVLQIYDHFGYEMRDSFRQTLNQTIKESKKYKSNHTYSFEEMGISHQQILDTYANIFERFGFNKNEQVRNSQDLND